MEQIDEFIATFTKPFAKSTITVYTCYLKGFLKFLYKERKIRKNYASLIQNPPVFVKSKPPKFLRSEELNLIFKSLQHASTPRSLGTNAMIHLIYYLGLRPDEISKITLNDISFRGGVLKIHTRKGKNPTILPIPDNVLKAIAAYIIGGRPKTDSRGLFITLSPPYVLVSATSVSRYIAAHMRQINLTSSAYWLRHSFAQSMLEAGVPLHDISKMMGHECTDSTAKYISINLKLMREVLF